MTSDPSHAPTFTIVTGADARFERCLWQLLRSAQRLRLQARHAFVAYDLGLSQRGRGTIARLFPWCLIRRLDASSLPPHAAVSRATFAWKPLALHQAALEFGGLLLWIDSACILRSSLDAVALQVRRYGVYTLAGQSQLQEHCDPQVREAAGAPAEILHERERVGGVVGFDWGNPLAQQILAEWGAMAGDARFWRAASERHKPDQALLSILVLKEAQRGRLVLSPGEVDISSASPVRWLTTRNKVPRWMPLWADPLVRLYYSGYKWADRVLIRLKRWKARSVDGWHRFPKEHFQVYLGRIGQGPLCEVPSPRGGYHADPFIAEWQGRSWVFMEQFLYGKNAGRLVAAPVSELLEVGEPAPLDIPGEHLSFPFVLEHDGSVFMVPETSAARAIDLYACAQFPLRWRLARRLVADVDAADSVLLRHGGRWWLFTSVRAAARSPGRYLALYHADDLLGGHFEPHPVNEERRFVGDDFGSGRCAGRFLSTAGGELLRPVQASRRYYGEGLRFMRVARLCPDAYEETEFVADGPVQALVSSYSPHHVCLCGGLVALDRRDRTSYAQHIPLLGRLGARPPLISSSGR